MVLSSLRLRELYWCPLLCISMLLALSSVGCVCSLHSGQNGLDVSIDQSTTHLKAPSHFSGEDMMKIVSLHAAVHTGCHRNRPHPSHPTALLQRYRILDSIADVSSVLPEHLLLGGHCLLCHQLVSWEQQEEAPTIKWVLLLQPTSFSLMWTKYGSVCVCVYVCVH